MRWTIRSLNAQSQLTAAGLLKHTDADRVRTRGGFSLLDLKRFAEARGFKAGGFHRLTLEQLLEFKSPIVPVDAYGAEAHFVVVMGRVDGDRIVLADPAFGNHVVSVSQFLAMWQDGLGFTVNRP
jgi:predicted double-glycine peptidase